MANGPKDRSEDVRRGKRLAKALGLMHWGVKKFATRIGQRITIVRNWRDGTRGEMPDAVLEWFEMVSSPLKARPLPSAAWVSSSDSDMQPVEFEMVLEAMEWDDASLAKILVKSDDRDEFLRLLAHVKAMRNGVRPVPRALADWLRFISGPMRANPMPDPAHWTPRVVITVDTANHRTIETPIPGQSRQEHERKIREEREKVLKAERDAQAKRLKSRHTTIEQAAASRADRMQAQGKFHRAMIAARKLTDPAKREAAVAAARATHLKWRVKRMQAIRQLKDEHDWTFAEIAKRFAVSRQRAAEVYHGDESDDGDDTAIEAAA